MNLYTTAISLHVIAALLGLGPLSVLALAAASPAPGLPRPWFARLLRVVAGALGVMLVTGMFLIAQTHGALGRAVWMRVAVGLFVVLGALLGLVRRRLRSGGAANPDGPLPAGVGPLLWTMCGLVAAITYLMEAKPW